MAYIHVIRPEDAEEELKAVYDGIAATRGKIAEVHKIQSLNAPTIPAHMELYRTVMFSHSPLSRAEREMMAVVVSQTNRCRYCVAHHGAALVHFWKKQTRVDALARATADGHFDGDGSNAVPADDVAGAVAASSDDVGLSLREDALCRFARRVTNDPGSGEDGSAVAQLRAAVPEIADRAVLDATLVIGYFNFVNRIVLTLGVELESDPGGYTYSGE
ncbi:MAG: carboxymuconolactone decarboxylase family protein [Spirochaeta sp.]|jgi:AhpD family alkylhydroperoxidase|nr:carboxymuconolactone decarboxylase family protein [Spirochaeta sp.]